MGAWVQSVESRRGLQAAAVCTFLIAGLVKPWRTLDGQRHRSGHLRILSEPNTMAPAVSSSDRNKHSSGWLRTMHVTSAGALWDLGLLMANPQNPGAGRCHACTAALHIRQGLILAN